MAQAAKDLLYLFQRPLEPIFTKRDNGRVAFDMPEDFYTDRYRPICQSLMTRYSQNVDRRISLRPIDYPDLSFANNVRLKGPFSLFNTTHRECAARLTKILLDQADISKLLSAACFCKDRINPYLFQYCLTVAATHRPDTMNLNYPAIIQTFPDLFIDSSIFPKALEEAAIIPQNQREFVVIPINFTATDMEIEQKMAYFREDIGANIHHWHWHLVYPADGDDRVVNKDRRGELFYYMHSQIITRFNVERICNGLGRTLPLENWREPIPEGYFPKIIRSTNRRSWPGRVANAILSDLNRPEDNTVVTIADMETWRDRIYDAIEQGFVVNAAGNRLPLDEVSGIDLLGNIVEASSLSVNSNFYGNIHNEGHNIISFVHDPDGRFLEEFGVMGDTTTAMRDPLFYRWHKFLDNLFRRHKNKLRQYTVETDLGFNGVSMDSVQVQITKGTNPAPNILLTFWQRADVDLAAGLDFGPEGNIFAQFIHLQHAPFEYRISVTNSNKDMVKGTCRIFLCPRFDETGHKLTYVDQRYLLIEMDKFTVNLTPGINAIRRASDESSVTIPYERSFRRFGSQFLPKNEADLAQFRFCGCGWPQHLLVPKGTTEGLMFDVFVMISNFVGDTVNQQVDPSVPCNDAASFCGIKDSLYPDRRSMGFPFDRDTQVADLNEFVQQSPNMGLGECLIRFTNTIVNRPNN